MTDLTSFSRTDLFNDHLAADVNKLIAAALRAEYANTETISATKTLVDNDCPLQFLTASGGNQNVPLPASAITNHVTIIYNAGSSNNLVVKDNASTNTLATLAPSEYAICYPLNAPGWGVIVQVPTTLYKLNPTVAANNLTLTVTHLDGSNASATRPIMVVIAGVKRYIIAALSVVKNAATNWCNAGSSGAGSAGLATNEIDWFAYFIWNTTPATDVVDIAFARKPYFRVFSEGSATTTNENYIAFGSASTPTSTDEMVLAGRFAATLSATASFNWSVPAYTNANLIHVPIDETRPLSWTPAHTRSTTGYTNAPTVNLANYIIKGREMFVEEVHTQNATPGGTGYQQITMPFANPVAQAQIVPGINIDAVTQMFAYLFPSAVLVSIIKYDSTAEATASQKYTVSGKMRIG